VRMRRLVRSVAQLQNSVGGLLSINYYPTRCITFSSSLLNSTTSAAQSAGFVVDGTASGYSAENDENNESEYEDFDSDELEDWEDPLHPTQYRERKIDKYGQAHGVGRRKTAVARVWIKPGVGQVKVNHQDVAEYFQNGARSHALEAFQVTETAGLFDVWCLVRGGGFMGKKFISYSHILISNSFNRTSWCCATWFSSSS
jgi:hypothetical protein